MQIIKIMKTIYTFILLNLFFITCKSQQTYDLNSFSLSNPEYGRYYKDLQGCLNQFVGTWKNVTGNKTFKITLYKEEKHNFDIYYMDIICGDYEMIENEGQPNETVLYKSKKIIGTTGNYFTPAIRTRGACAGIGGTIIDNTTMTITNMGNLITGNLSFYLTSTNTAQWKVDILEGLRVQGTTAFSLPMNLVMTKQ